MKLQVKISKLKAIKELFIELPAEKGIYAITGLNASGKSTLVAAAATAFYNAPMERYFGKTVDNGALISFKMGDESKSWTFNGKEWRHRGYIHIKGFYEGSIIFGNRFRDTNFDALFKIEKVIDKDLKSGHELIRKNLGKILHNNVNFYDRLLTIYRCDAKTKYHFIGIPYFIEKNGRRVSQYHMSTGENLLITILHSILERTNDRKELNTPCLLLLDEIELALHPSSLSRLLSFLKKTALEYNMAIYFSTHSIELIHEINPENIFFLERMADNTISIINPCYPSYATRILYEHSGYDIVILVEDDLSKLIIDRLLRKLRLLNNRLVHVMPCGGWSNVIKIAVDAIESNLFSKPTKIIILLDRDVQSEVESFIRKNYTTLTVSRNYLPVQSLEKFLLKYLFKTVNHELYRFLNDYLFQHKSLNAILEEYKGSPYSRDDSNGKFLYSLIESELKNRNKTRNDLVELIVDFMTDKNMENITDTSQFLIKELGSG